MGTSGGRSKQDPAEHSIHFDFWPWDEYTAVRVYIRSLVGGHADEVIVWTGNLRTGRRDLAGRTPADCAILLSDRLWNEWSNRRSQGAMSDPAGGPGAPVGATGATVTSIPLPGL